MDINQIVSKPAIERAILSILIKDKFKVIECSAENVFAEHFSIKANQIIYSVLNFLAQKEDVNTFDNMLIYTTITDTKAKEIIEEAGGLDYIDALFICPVHDNIAHYIKQLKDTSLLRQAFAVSEHMKEEILNNKEDGDVNLLLSRFQDMILNISLQSGEDEEVLQVGSGLKERLRQIVENPKDVLGYQLGWKTWDKVTQGLCGNDLTVICGESKTGKSTLLLNIATILSVTLKISGLYIDTEMTTGEQEFRSLAMLSGVPFEEIRNGMYSKDTDFGEAADKVEAVNNAIELLNQSKLYHVYLPNFTIDKVSALVRRYKIQHNIGYFVFDYIKLPDSDTKTLASSQEYQKLGYFTSCLKNLCGICDIPGITACQSNRTAVGNTSLDANAIGGSYRILQLATRLCFIRNKQEFELQQENFTRGNQVLKIAFQRNGSSDGAEIDMQFDKKILRMREVGARTPV